jgi:hypothetical protein
MAAKLCDIISLSSGNEEALRKKSASGMLTVSSNVDYFPLL